MESCRIDNGGVELALSVVGEGQDLLFVHGLRSSQPMWAPMVRSMQDRFRCWTLDLRGHGASAWAPGGYHLAGFASDVSAALRHIAAPTVGIGHSLGGMAVADAAIAGHPNLRSAYLIEAPLFPVDGVAPPGFDQQLDLIRRYQQEGRSPGEFADLVSRAPAPGGGTLGDRLVPEQLAAIGSAFADLDPEVMVARLDGSLRVEPRAPTFAVPTRVLAADPELGPAVGPDAVAALADLSPATEVRTILGLGHPMMMIRGFDESVTADLVDWLEQLDLR
ncbi:MAG: alpha/beta hydrolase [Actinomycetota bacterium]